MSTTDNHIAVIWSTDVPFTRHFRMLKKHRKKEEKYRHLSNWKLIDSDPELKKTDFRHFEKAIILLELNWPDRENSILYGLEVLKFIRLTKSSAIPITFASFLDRKKN